MSYTRVKTPQEIKAMRESGRQLAVVLDYLRKKVKPGMSTLDLDELAVIKLRSLGGSPAFKGYYGFPNSLCVSVNDEVVHGIPSKHKIIQAGDIVSMDFGVVVDGMITDAAISVVVGTTNNSKYKQLVETTAASLQAGIDQIHGGVKVGTIANAVQQVLEKQHLGIVKDLVGHGVGHELHEDPNIPNYGRKDSGPELLAGMTIAVEPMATLGSDRVVVDGDGWTIRTQDGSWSAHFEHTILITENGAEILTKL